MFSEIKQEAIREKVELLKKIKDGTMSSKELADLITQRRAAWIEVHLDEMLLKYAGLSPEEQAYRIVFFDHMQINPEHSKMKRISETKIRIDSYNICPYLQACRQLGLETRYVCREIGEPSINKMLAIINPGLKFSRNYDNIRPYNEAFCEEYIELVNSARK